MCCVVNTCILLTHLLLLSVSFSQTMKVLGRQISPDVKQIDIDVLRTFRNHIMYRDRYGIKQQALFHVLVAYSMYNPVGITPYMCTSNF